HARHAQRGTGPDEIDVVLNEGVRVTALQGDHHLVDGHPFDRIASCNGEQRVAGSHDDLPAGRSLTGCRYQGPLAIDDARVFQPTAFRAQNDVCIGVRNQADLVTLLPRHTAYIDKDIDDRL